MISTLKIAAFLRCKSRNSQEYALGILEFREDSQLGQGHIRSTVFYPGGPHLAGHWERLSGVINSCWWDPKKHVGA